MLRSTVLMFHAMHNEGSALRTAVRHPGKPPLTYGEFFLP